MPVNFRCDRIGETTVQILILLQIFDPLFHLGRELHRRILLFRLMHVHRLQEGILQQTRPHRSETRIGRGQKHARHVNHISRIDAPRARPVQMDRHTARNVPDGDLIGHFLDLHLLERLEPTGARLHVQLPVRLVLDALLGRAGREGRECLLGDFLEYFVSA